MKKRKNRLRGSLDLVGLVGGAVLFLAFLMMMAVR